MDRSDTDMCLRSCLGGWPVGTTVVVVSEGRHLQVRWSCLLCVSFTGL